MPIDTGELSDALPRLYRYALRLSRDPDLAADVVQDTAERALARADQWRGEVPLERWLYRIAHNVFVDRVRRAGRESPREIPVEEAEADWRDDDFTVDAEAVVERAALREELQDALLRLPFVYRAAVVLHDIEGFTVPRIAESFDISLPAAKQRLRRGRMALVRALAEGHERRRATRDVPLRCWDARQHVSDYLDDRLDAPTRRAVETHLASCPTCPPLYAALVGVRAELDRLRDPDTVVPPDLARRLEATLAGAGATDPRPPRLTG